MIWKKIPITTRHDWLDRLGKHLVWYFPATQVRDILSDYREQFEAGQERGRTEAELVEAMGATEDVLGQLLEEEPSAKMARLRTSGLWAAVLAVCCAFMWINLMGNSLILFWGGACAFILAASAALFLLLRGPSQMAVEKQLSPDRDVSPVMGYCIPFVLVLVFEVTAQVMFTMGMAGRLPEYIGPFLNGEFLTLLILIIELILAALAVWLLFRSVTVSIRYFPGISHILGAAVSLFFVYAYITAMSLDVLWIPAIDLLLRLLPYFTGLAAAWFFQRWVDGRRPLPLLFQDKRMNQPDWLHQLGVDLLGWFPAEQAIEILEDYQEQFELGEERGKSEEEIISDLGRPSAVVRDLLAEDWKARARRRRTWPWAVTLAAAGYLLLGILRAYELGGVGFQIFYFSPVKVSNIALVMWTAALYVLLRVRSRSAVEARFPVRRRPTARIFLLPVLAFALTMGFSLFLIHLAFHKNLDIIFLSRPLRWYLADIIDFSVLTLLFLLIWTLARCFSGSIRYLPAAVHVVGSMASILCMGIFFRVGSGAMESSVRGFLPVMLPYFFGVVLSIWVWLVVRFAGKPRKEG